MNYARILSQPTPQRERLSPAQVQNHAGGFVFALDDWARLERFLILGSDAPTYYQSARALTKENAAVVDRCYSLDAERTVASIVDVSTKARAPKNDSAIFALAVGMAHSDVKARQVAANAVNQVCRTATHLFEFVSLTRVLGRGRGRSMIRAMANWYNAKPADAVAFQAVKYRERAGYTHRDLLRLSRPQSDLTPARRALYSWMVGKPFEADDAPAVLNAHIEAMKLQPGRELYKLMVDHKLPWEAVPTEAKADAGMWRAALPFMGLTALIRNLGQMTRLGVIAPLSVGEQAVVARLVDENELRRSRIHPFALLQAIAVYGAGRPVAAQQYRSASADRSWRPSQAVLDALDKAFYKAFANVVPTGKRHLLGIDVSASMSSPIAGSAVACNQAAACLALLTMSIEPASHAMMFDQGMRDAQITPRDRLDTALRKIKDINGGGTDCSLPMLYALERKISVDAFVVLTDSETWAGSVHPCDALRRYRSEMGIAAKLIVVAMTSTGFSIADPSDSGMLDIVGFDAAAPAVMANFVRGGAPAVEQGSLVDENDA